MCDTNADVHACATPTLLCVRLCVSDTNTNCVRACVCLAPACTCKALVLCSLLTSPGFSSVTWDMPSVVGSCSHSLDPAS